jgi:uncharacterized protein YndB with AHSA1/START domain
MARVVKEVRIERPADEVWAVVGDYEAIPSWLPAITEAKVQGEERLCTMGEQGLIREHILSRDEAARRYEYTIVDSPLPITSHRASMEVRPAGESSVFVWTMDIEPDELAQALDPTLEQGLAGLKARLEG